MDKGALFTNANYNYVPTYTAPGHAAIFTGSVPAQNGIVGNNWFDRDAPDGEDPNKYIVADPTLNVVTSYGIQSNTKSSKPASPRILIGTTIGDQMRLANNFKSKVIAMSLKDRAAVLPGGKEANAAYWFDGSSGQMISTDYYFSNGSLPKWVNKFNAESIADKAYDQVWDLKLNRDAYARTELTTPQSSGDGYGDKMSRNFPHKLNKGRNNEDWPKGGVEYYTNFTVTPFASDYLADFAKAAIEGESLGTDKYPDLLAISFSSPDLAGHAYGPDSEEVEDTYIRLDQTIAELLNYIDGKVGLANTLIAVTGDHGVAPVPQLMSSPSYKVDADVIDPKPFRDAARQALSAKYGNDDQCDADTSLKHSKCWIQALVNDQLYLNHDMMTDKKTDSAEAERIAGEAIMRVHAKAGSLTPPIARYFTRTEIVEGRMPPGAVSQRIMNGFNPSRSGDLWLIPKAFSFFSGEGSQATTHGGVYNYDTHVPIILFGPGVRPGRYYTECSPSDIAPTMAAMLGIEPPSNRVGRVLSEALSPE